MNFTVKKSDLQRALGLAQGVAERRATIPILTNVMLSFQGIRLALTVSDMDMELTALIDAQLSGKPAGSITLPVHTLFDICKKAAGEAISFTATGDSTVAVTSGKAKFKLGTLPVDDFPVFRAADDALGFKIPAAALTAMMAEVKHAMSTEDTRYYLNGIYFHGVTRDEQTYLRAVATDGHRMAVKDAPCDIPTGDDFPAFILPRKACAELGKMLEGYEGDVGAAVGENTAAFDIPDLALQTKLIDGTYPDYQRVIPKGNDKFLRLDSQPLLAALARVTAVASDKSRAVKVSLTKNKAVLSCHSPDVGSATEEMDCAYTGAPLEIGFNASYLQSVLDRCQGEVQADLADPASPCIIRAVDNGSTVTDALHLLMPLRV